MDKRFAVVVAGALPIVSMYPLNVLPENANHITLSVPNGWDDVKHLSKKVLDYAGKTFVFTGWNSDTNQIYFKRSNAVAHVRN
jgi:hypothetical protein